MTKLNWDKADRYEKDPGSVIDVPDTTSHWTPPEERKRKENEAAERRKELRQKSEQHDHQLMVAGVMREIRRKEDLGIPLSGWDRLLLNQREDT